MISVIGVFVNPPQCPDLQLLVGVVVDQLLVITVVAAESFKLVAGHFQCFLSWL